jgi:NADH-quinone oxidoreductase subunit F
MVQLLEKIEAGDASHADLDLLESIGTGILGRSLCALGDFAVYPVSSFMRKFPDEFRAHVERGSCPFGDTSTLDGILAPSDVHAQHAEEAVHA